MEEDEVLRGEGAIGSSFLPRIQQAVERTEWAYIKSSMYTCVSRLVETGVEAWSGKGMTGVVL